MDLSKEQAFVLDKMLNTDDNIFLTGEAGTGKSFVIKEFISKTDKKILVTSMTGIAAYQIGGSTIHSALGIKALPVYAPKNWEGSLKDKDGTERLVNKIDTLIIDEISMVRADFFDLLNTVFQKLRHNELFFGGIQVIVVGDLYQLEPVTTYKDPKTQVNSVKYIRDYYGSPFFITLPAVQSAFKLVCLHEIFRQSDPYFKELLNNVRVRRDLTSTLIALNKCVKPYEDDNETVMICGKKSVAFDYNKSKRDALPGPCRCYTAMYSSGLDEEDFPAPEKLFFKEGSKVMTTVNNRQDGYVNGSVGIITKMEDDTIHVMVKNELVIVHPYDFTISRKIVNECGQLETKVYTYTQFPLQEAWAITVHKSQGQTFDKVHIDLDKAWAHGQMYVALSRCRSLQGLSLQYSIKNSDIKISSEIVQFMQGINC